MKVLLPNAMNCGCNYELFWHLNPRKLEPFFEAYRLKMKEQVTMQDSFAWLQGVYVRDAFLSCINKSVTYPKGPMGLNQDSDYSRDQDTESRSPHKKMSDGQNFALFMVKHNKALSAKRAKQQNNA
jgi:hypothetical protein